MADKTRDNNAESRFYSNLPASLSLTGDWVEQRLLSEYGAVFVVGGGAGPPPKVIFKSESEVSEFQSGLRIGSAVLGEFSIELQEPAMTALLDAATDAASAGLSINPRGADSSRRDYEGTIELWLSRVEPGLKHWVANGKLDPAAAESVRALSPFEQVPAILTLEQEGIYFAKDLAKSIIYSVAPPGTSQHLSMLAMDIVEFDDPMVRDILARRGWFQTVVSDLPHFTFLGVPESELSGLGLRSVESGCRKFWVPDMGAR